MNTSRRSFLRTVVAIAALSVVPAFAQRETRRLLALRDIPFQTSRYVLPGDTLTLRYWSALGDLVLMEHERAFDCHERFTCYGATVATYDDGSCEVLKPVDHQVMVATA